MRGGDGPVHELRCRTSGELRCPRLPHRGCLRRSQPTEGVTTRAPSAPDCEWYGSVGHDYYQWSQRRRGSGSLRRQGSGWSGPSDDPTCRGTVHESYVAHQTQSEGWYHQEAEGTVTATYWAGWEGSEPGAFGAYFTGDESVTGERTDFTGGDAGTFELTRESRGYCVVPNADTDAKRAKIQAVVITCSSESPGDQSTTSTIRMRRTNCDKTVDTDGDGSLSDCKEFALQTEPQNIDTDGDGLTDGQEVLTFGTNPRDTDSDDGSVDDFEEVERGTDPLNPEDDVAEPDCDDGISNDFDGLIDYPADPGCLSSTDDELGPGGVRQRRRRRRRRKCRLTCRSELPRPDRRKRGLASGADDTINRVYTTLEGVAALGAVAYLTPTLEPSVSASDGVGDDGPVIEQANPTASLSGNWVFLGALGEFRSRAFPYAGDSLDQR